MKSTGSKWKKSLSSNLKSGLIVLGIVILICMFTMTSIAGAQSYTPHFNWNCAVAALAEQEVKSNGQDAEDKVAVNDSEKDFLVGLQEADSSDNE